MNYRNVGKSGLKVSEIAVGSWMTDLAGKRKAEADRTEIELPDSRLHSRMCKYFQFISKRKQGFE